MPDKKYIYYGTPDAIPRQMFVAVLALSGHPPPPPRGKLGVSWASGVVQEAGAFVVW